MHTHASTHDCSHASTKMFMAIHKKTTICLTGRYYLRCQCHRHSCSKDQWPSAPRFFTCVGTDNKALGNEVRMFFVISIDVIAECMHMHFDYTSRI